MSEKNTVKVNGVEVPFDKAKLGDVRFVMMLGELNDETLDDAEKMPVLPRMMRFLFGGERYRIQDEIADANGGNLDITAFSEWLAAYFEAVNAKN